MYICVCIYKHIYEKIKSIDRQTSFHCASLYSALQILCFFYKLKVCGNLVSSKSVHALFSNSICSLCVSGSHFGHSLNISNFFSIIIFVTVICGQ